ncbi:MAG TPA: 3-oxoacid CoA-transferase, partial [Devosia sp.]|nr:3-oxoacid CoA-transferase [Devosia sp.]
NQRFVLREKLAGLSLDDLQAVTGAELLVDGAIGDLVVPEI